MILEKSYIESLKSNRAKRIATIINETRYLPFIGLLSGGGDATVALFSMLTQFFKSSILAGVIPKLPIGVSAVSGSTYIGLLWYSAFRESYLRFKRSQLSDVRNALFLDKLAQPFFDKLVEFHILDFFEPLLDPAVIKQLGGVVVFDAAGFEKQMQQLTGFAKYPKFIVPTTYAYRIDRILDSASLFNYNIGKSIWTAITLPSAIVPYRTANEIYYDAGTKATPVVSVIRNNFRKLELVNGLTLDWSDYLKIGFRLNIDWNGALILKRTLDKVHRKTVRFWLDLLNSSPQLRKLVSRLIRANEPDKPDDVDVLFVVNLPKQYATFILTPEEKVIVYYHIKKCIEQKYRSIGGLFGLIVKQVLPNLDRLASAKSWKQKAIWVCE